jgi:predicted nuclease of predicted toxin-antitoxin system
MKLLLDENLPPALAKAIDHVFPGSAHVQQYGLGATDDATIWAYAKQKDFVIVTKDSDFEELSMLHGAPPKVIWLRTGNCTTDNLNRLLCMHADTITAFGQNPTDAILEIARTIP